MIVFTHDLTFVYKLSDYCEGRGLECVTHWVRSEGGKPGFVYPNNSPANESEYKSAQKAREFYAQSKGLQPTQEERVLQLGFAALRTSYEVLVINGIFNDVVCRFQERISFGRLKDVRVEPAVLSEIDSNMGRLSRYIEGHSHSDLFAGSKPTRETLLSEIEVFESLKDRQNKLKKA